MIYFIGVFAVALILVPCMDEAAYRGEKNRLNQQKQKHG